MATFEFACRKCKETFAVPNLSLKESRSVKCIKCATLDVELVGYDRANTQAMYRLAKALSALETRVDAIIDFIQECAESDETPELKIPEKQEPD